MHKNFNACDPSFVLVVWVIHDFEFEWLYWNRLSVKNYSLMYRQPNYMYFLHNYKLVYESSIWHNSKLKLIAVLKKKSSISQVTNLQQTHHFLQFTKTALNKVQWLLKFAFINTQEFQCLRSPALWWWFGSFIHKNLLIKLYWNQLSLKNYSLIEIEGHQIKCFCFFAQLQNLLLSLQNTNIIVYEWS